MTESAPPPGPQAPDVTDAPQTPDAPDVAQTPDAPDAAQTPDAPDVAQTPDAPDAPQAPDASSAPEGSSNQDPNTPPEKPEPSKIDIKKAEIQKLVLSLLALVPAVEKAKVALSAGADGMEIGMYAEQARVFTQEFVVLDEMLHTSRALLERDDLTDDQVEKEYDRMIDMNAASLERILSKALRAKDATGLNERLFSNVLEGTEERRKNAQDKLSKLGLRLKNAHLVGPYLATAREKVKELSVEKVTDEIRRDVDNALNLTEELLKVKATLVELCREHMETYFRLLREMAEKEAQVKDAPELPEEIKNIDTTEIDAALNEKYDPLIAAKRRGLHEFSAKIGNDQGEKGEKSFDFESKRVEDEIDELELARANERTTLVLQEQANQSRSIQGFDPTRLNLTIEINDLKGRSDNLLTRLGNVGGFLERVSTALKLLGVDESEQKEGEIRDREQLKVDIFIQKTLEKVTLALQKIKDGPFQTQILSKLGPILGYSESLTGRKLRVLQEANQMAQEQVAANVAPQTPDAPDAPAADAPAADAPDAPDAPAADAPDAPDAPAPDAPAADAPDAPDAPAADAPDAPDAPAPDAPAADAPDAPDAPATDAQPPADAAAQAPDDADAVTAAAGKKDDSDDEGKGGTA